MSRTVTIVGATGAVGVELIHLLEAREFPLSDLRLLASPRSAGKTLRFRDAEFPVSVLESGSFEGVDLAFFSAGGSLSREFAPAAVAAGATVIDNSSAFRMDPGVPLVVPEINGGALSGAHGIIANPNCTTIVALMAVAPLARVAGAVALRAASYQAASGAGAGGIRELESQNRAIARGEAPSAAVFPWPLAGNVIPHIGGFLEGGETEEERKFSQESRKILDLPDLRVSATCVRVPVPRAHAVACWLTTRDPLTPAEAREILAAAPGVSLLDEPEALSYPMPVTAAGRHQVQVGRIRVDKASDSGLALFAVGDQLLKGAALNAVQIAEALLEEGTL
jgi:aspartate-semialdehyde dehydrogenase